MAEATNSAERPAIAVVGMACEYPGASSPFDLWENLLAERRAFRRIPAGRLRSEDYYSADRSAPDRTYAMQAALIEGYEFDRLRFRVAGSTYRAVDLTHWLALDVATRALADAGYPEGQGLPTETTGVLVGNSLTGEFSRAGVLRLRWPYVSRVVDAALHQRGWDSRARRGFLEDLESVYKAPFAPVGEESLAGGLSNTIAGRICNHYDLKGGGYTVDGACSSSLLAISTACAGLVSGNLDVALAGGVDLSIDPFEIVGFAKIGALASEEMRIYDARSQGFWPGEGCGVVVLMRLADALAQSRRVYACIRGWGISSDGKGGITRPEIQGQILAVNRAYKMAGFGPDSVSYFEGHGTGTPVGDATELRVLARARSEAGSGPPPAAIGSIKANIGHTKAAAGVAGLIKAVLSLDQEILPPTTGSEIPHPELVQAAPFLRTLRRGEAWQQDRPFRAGVSSMGFGGINVHLALEKDAAPRRRGLSKREETLLHSAQDAELFLLSGDDAVSLLLQVARLLDSASGLSRYELADLAAELARQVAPSGMRIAIVAATPQELTDRLRTVHSWLTDGESRRVDLSSGIFLGSGAVPPKIGFLFPGQGAPAHRDGGALPRRFEVVRELYEGAGLPVDGDDTWTAVAQPSIVTASLAGLRVLQSAGITASVAVGHSLGELTALHWGGAYDEAALIRIAKARGQAMADVSGPSGAMASIGADASRVEALIGGEGVVVSGLNAPQLTNISGPFEAVERVVARARTCGIPVTRLKVSHAFHSPMVAPAVPVLKRHLESETFLTLLRDVASTVTGGVLTPQEDTKELLGRQVLQPVRFFEALRAAAGVDLLIEVGPGRTLSGLASTMIQVPVVSMDAGGASVSGLLKAIGACFALGAKVDHRFLFADRFTRPFDSERKSTFFINPCELAPVIDGDGPLPAEVQEERDGAQGKSAGPTPLGSRGGGSSAIADPLPRSLDGAASSDESSPSIGGVALSPSEVLELVRGLVAQRVELPVSSVLDDHRLLDDLHLNSIVVGQIVSEAAARLELPRVASPTNFADATVSQVARAMVELSETKGTAPDRELQLFPPGVDSWVRPFTLEMVERPMPRPLAPQGSGGWLVLGPADDPFLAALERRLDQWGGGGVLVYLPPESTDGSLAAADEATDLLLKGARETQRRGPPSHFVLVHRGSSGASFAKTLHLEVSGLTTTVVELPGGDALTAEQTTPAAPAADLAEAVARVVDEISATVGFAEIRHDREGRRWEPFLRLLPESGPAARADAKQTIGSLGHTDLLLVTGGGKGIAAECAFELAKRSGVKLALLGRSRPEADPVLAANLKRLGAAGVRFEYFSADVTDLEAVRVCTRDIEARLGPVTALLHAAGANEPKLIRSLDGEIFRQTAGPKVDGIQNVISALSQRHLKLIVAFGSIIARTGMRGEADYALANERLSKLVERYQVEHPDCRCLSLEWSIWSGVGMGERLGRVESLLREGVTPITTDQGVDFFCKLLESPFPRATVVVGGRFGKIPTLQIEPRELPILRFLERVTVDFPGIELVMEADLSSATDPYLEDHIFRQARVLPAVLGLEAMAQAFRALTGCRDAPVFEHVEFQRPVIVPEGGTLTIRVAALVREPGAVEIVLRSAETSFLVDHFRGTCRTPDAATAQAGLGCSENPRDALLPLDPRRELYGDLLFHHGRFRRLEGYSSLSALECEAQLSADGNESWFSPYLPPELTLGDPGARDAAIHAIQACIPHATILPVGVDRILSASLAKSDRFRIHAIERRREGSLFIYDLVIAGEDGSVLERWEGLRLRVVEEMRGRKPWPLPLLVPYLERVLEDLGCATGIKVALEESPAHIRGSRGSQGERAIKRALRGMAAVMRRPDGKPEAPGGWHVSASHMGRIVLAASGRSALSCDLESVAQRSRAVWEDLLGIEGWALAERLSSENGDPIEVSATRVWSARECLKKSGASSLAPLVLSRARRDGWVCLVSGQKTLATFAAAVREREAPLVLAFLFEGQSTGASEKSLVGGNARI